MILVKKATSLPSTCSVVSLFDKLYDMGKEEIEMKIPFQIELSKQRIIRADFFPASHEAEGILIICHGFKGFKDWGMFPYVANYLAKQLHVVTFNFSHNGVGEDLYTFSELDKFAQNTFSRELEDLDLLISHLRQAEQEKISQLAGYNLSTLPILLLGHSRGGAVSLIYAFDHPEKIRAVISWNGLVDVHGLFPNDLREAINRSGRGYTYNGRTKQQMPIDKIVLDDLAEHKERFNIIERAKQANTPIALIQGTEDVERLRQGSAQLVKANPTIRWIQIDGGDHTFKTVHPFQGESTPLKEALACTEEFIHSLHLKE